MIMMQVYLLVKRSERLTMKIFGRRIVERLLSKNDSQHNKSP
jgi:hypothetical protein